MSSHEQTNTGIEAFSPDMSRDAARAATQDLHGTELVQFWSTFEPTPEINFPAIATGRVVDDVAAVLAGAKPATTIGNRDMYDHSFAELARERPDLFKQLAVTHAVDGDGYLHRFLGKQENVDRLAELYRGRNAKSATDDFHRAVGEALGYPAAAIDDYIADRAAQRNRRNRSLARRIWDFVRM